MMTEDERAARGHRAANELAETQGAFDAVEAAIMREMGQTPVSQPDKVLKLHMALQNISAVRQALRHVIDDGLMADAAIASAGLTRPN